jgi:hypothetical protein
MSRICTGALLAALICGTGPAAAEELSDISSFVKTLRECTHGSDTLSVAVVGFLGPEADRLLEPQEREATRAAMERALVGADAHVRTTALKDLGFVLEWQREAGTSESRLKELFRRSHDVHAVIMFEIVERSGQRLVWRARGFSPEGDCSSPSRDQVSSVVTSRSAASVRGLFDEIARELFARRPLPSSIAIMPFNGDAGLVGDCDEELRDLLAAAIADGGGTASAANNTITDSHIDVYQVRRDPAPDRDALARGDYGVDSAGLWVRVELTNRKGQVLGLKPRTTVTGTTCRGSMKRLVDFVHDSQHVGGDLALEMPAAPRIGDLVDIRIRNSSEQPVTVLCWNVAEDGTAEVMTPLHDPLRSIRPHGQLSFPRDFGRRSNFTQEARDLFGCFGVRGALTPAVRELWAQAWPETSAAPRQLTRDEALRLLDVMRSTDGISEVSVIYRVIRH